MTKLVSVNNRVIVNYSIYQIQLNLGFIFKFLEILSGVGEACGIGDDFFMGTCCPGLSCNHGLCKNKCNKNSRIIQNDRQFSVHSKILSINCSFV